MAIFITFSAEIRDPTRDGWIKESINERTEMKF